MTALLSGDDFFVLLGECEERLADVRGRRSALRRGRIALLGVVLLGAVGLVGATGPTFGPDQEIVVLASAVVGLAVVAAWILLLRLGRRLLGEERKMLEDIDRLREVLAHFARRENWDDERIRSARRRLSAFPNLA